MSRLIQDYIIGFTIIVTNIIVIINIITVLLKRDEKDIFKFNSDCIRLKEECHMMASGSVNHVLIIILG